MTTIPTLTTERLTLRAPRLSDFDAYAAFRASERARFVGGPDNQIKAWGQFIGLPGQWAIRGYGRWIAADRDTDAPVGVVGLLYPIGWPEPEIAWSIFVEAEGRGLAQEAALAARHYAYETAGWTTAISLIDPANTRSVALAERLGCQPEGAFQHAIFGAMQIWRHPAPATEGMHA
ncbi:GNAT family N-acetyltransferase [Roseicyclus sp.]|uniref:GNAT family N-acetyltransferase n=1 Tax=Roseicyclus sp. TaxID=1914329 RepID=UPI003F6C6BD9